MVEHPSVPSSSPAQRPSWYVRHQGKMAVFGSVIALATFFAKERLQEHWRRKAEDIRAAERVLTSADDSVRLRSAVLATQEEVEVLGRDAYALEQHKKPTAETDRRQTNTESMKIELLWKTRDSLVEAEPVLEALRTLSTALDRRSDAAVASLQSELTKTEKDLGLAFQQSSAPQNDVDSLIFASYKIEVESAHIRANLQKTAEGDRQRSEKRVAWTDGLLSVLFVLGLALSLLGKLSGAEAELPEI